MSSSRTKNEKVLKRSILHAFIIGLILLIVISFVTSRLNYVQLTDSAQKSIDAMKQQCLSYDKIVASDRTKSLFHLIDTTKMLQIDLKYNENHVNDPYLESYCNKLRVSGVALLDEDLQLEASGYTRQFLKSEWINEENTGRYYDILQYPEKIYTDRIMYQDEYYDLCVMSREDAKGIIITYYHQPSGLITNIENDLQTFLNNIQMEKGGNYVIVRNGIISVSSDEKKTELQTEESELFQKLSQLPSEGKMKAFRANGRTYWGYHVAFKEDHYYVYYPFLIVFTPVVFVTALFVALYLILCLIYYSSRNKALYNKQKELEESNTLLTQTVEMLKALETIYFSLLYIDTRENTFSKIYVSPWLSDRVPENGSSRDLRKMLISDLVDEEYQKEVINKLSSVYIRENLGLDKATDGRKSYYFDFRGNKQDIKMWWRMTVTAVDYDDKGVPKHVLVLLQDVNKEKTKEAEYQARIMKEASDAKIANDAKTEFLRRISHDIRTPINGIRGYVLMASAHPEDMELQARCRENVNNAISTLMSLINGVLDMSKLESSEFTLEEVPFDLSELLDDLNSVMLPQAEARKIRYEATPGEDIEVCHLIGSPRHLSQLLLNLATNAIKYGHSNGYVRVSVKLLKKEDSKAWYEFVCEDDGIGMSEEFQKHMFEPFTQEGTNARTNYEGIGLGLSIVKKLVDAFNGTIRCKSKTNEGTRFEITIPFEINKNKAMKRAKQEISTDILKNKKVLLVEDNELNMEIATWLFEEHGASVIQAWNGKEALEIFGNSQIHEIDMVCMDIMMPVMDGLEATKEIRALEREDAKTVPIIAMSANAFSDDRKQSLEAGMNAHISKPIEVEKLLAVITSFLKENE